MMKVFWAVAQTAAAGVLLAGCSTTSEHVTPFASSTPAVAPAPAAPPPVVYGAFLDGPVGGRLSPSTKDKVLAVEQDALATGQKKTWKGDAGTFGFVEPQPAPAPKPPVNADGSPAPAPPPSGDACRTFTSTVFIGGRPQVGHGKGCQNPDGTFRVVS
jgi:surface antigen